MKEPLPAAVLYEQSIFLIFCVVISIVGTHIYGRFALTRGITARVTFRSLHKRVVPRGGGIVFGSIFCVATATAWLKGLVSTPILCLLGIGGAAAAVFGFLDDMLEIRAQAKIVAHVLLGIWAVFVLVQTPEFAAVALEGKWLLPMCLALVFVFVWFINLYNFIDGIDGMAAAGSVFVSASAVAVLLLTDGHPGTVLVLALIGVCAASFLVFNLPPARMFMGDSGSIFLGYTIAGAAALTVISGQMSVWTWLAILSYYIGDTTVTGAYRLLRVPKWYHPHRSHAYQNLARIYDSHALVTYGVNMYNLAWAFPMALWTVSSPQHAPLAAMLALAPVVLWTLRFGPRLSSS